MVQWFSVEETENIEMKKKKKKKCITEKIVINIAYI